MNTNASGSNAEAQCVLLRLDVQTPAGNVYSVGEIQVTLKSEYLAEWGSPKVHGNPNWLERVRDVDFRNVCAELSQVHIDVDRNAVVGTVRPTGPLANLMRQTMAEGQVSFAMRSLVKHNGDASKQVTVLTFDAVIPT
jgi:Peptidase S80 family